METQLTTRQLDAMLILGWQARHERALRLVELTVSHVPPTVLFLRGAEQLPRNRTGLGNGAFGGRRERDTATHELFS
jgi:hypothetical protein